MFKIAPKLCLPRNPHQTPQFITFLIMPPMAQHSSVSAMSVDKMVQTSSWLYGPFKYPPGFTKCLEIRHRPTCMKLTSVMTGPAFNSFQPVRCFFVSSKFSVADESQASAEGKKKLGEITPRLGISYKCLVCGNRNSHVFSKIAYEQGVVIVTCKSCNNNHLIADNLGWFQDVNERNIEEILAAKGEEINKVKCDIPQNLLEQLEQNNQD